MHLFLGLMNYKVISSMFPVLLQVCFKVVSVV